MEIVKALRACHFVGYDGGEVEEYNIEANNLAESQSEERISLLVYIELMENIKLTTLFKYIFWNKRPFMGAHS